MPKRLKEGGVLPTVQLDGANSQDVTVGAASAQSTVIGTSGQSNVLVYIVSTTAVRWLEGTNPTAVATSPLLPANVPIYTEITAGNKIAVLQESAGGNTSDVVGDLIAPV